MTVRTCPWKLDNGAICSAPPKDDRHRVGLCELHSSVQYMTQLATQGRLLTEARVTEHTPGFTYIALSSDGNYTLGYAGTLELLVPKLRKAFRFGELSKVVTLLDGGKSRYLTLVGQFSPFWIEGRNSTYAPEEQLTRIVTALPRSGRYSDLPASMTGQD
ncbi:hypothetical protein PV729_09265 [Streptomyces europaeiscabiei]|uniref:Uncharacterized protein n=1 Tax=Streptomyces europaeiscabiei TaxID=146819 RepID=A0ABU4NED0_9ACTN|nr:hypothetical protein [Streptomyces europaeiscabiei]MDX3541618.1 hypothetical protein [Streptomyces europaeiscabiei]MDX3551959.1 hypothetical protein [Streptomyces europaeiscabiei]MDX3700198.1 hypothetical protein [Streptomyces europaeiscabiei]